MKKNLTITIILFTFLGLSVTVTKAQYVTIPDANFVTWLTDNYPSCMNGNQMDTTCLEVVNETSINLPFSSYITNLTGITYFDNLESFTFYLSINNVPELPKSLKYINFRSSILNSLPTLPDSLLELSVNYCSLDSLPNLPSTLQKLFCNNNQLVFLPNLPGTLTDLHCPNNQLIQLPVLPNSLIYLECSNNQLIDLPLIPNTVSQLYCEYNALTSIPNLLNTIIFALFIGNNQLSSLPDLPASLIDFECQNNSLTELPTLPIGIGYIGCSNNLLTFLPALPNSLGSLDCSDNQIANLPTLPNHLLTLGCINNNLNSLPELPSTLINFYCENNNITCLPHLPASLIDVTNFFIGNNPFTCVPNYVAAMDAATLALPLCFANDSINNQNNCASAKGVLGHIYSDIDGNCIFNNSDIANNNVKVDLYNPINNQFISTYSHLNGLFHYSIDPGTYFVSVDTLNKPYQYNCLYPGIDSIVVTTVANPLSDYINFDIKCKPGIDLNVQSVNHIIGPIFPGQQHTLQVLAGNSGQWYGLNCINGTSGQVQITITGPVTYNGIVSGSLTPTINGNVYTFSIADFSTINNATDFQLLFTTDTTAQTGDQICVHVEVTPITGDNNPSNNIKDFCYSVVNSYDPNYKEVYPTNVAPLFQDWLTYTIHFQNLGNAPAINIRVLDTLDSNLEAETFEVINYSHYNTVTLMNGILDFRFPNILLPDSSSNPNGSQGFVQYRIKPKANLPVGTQIENTAHIYFDYNPAVVTNTTVNNFTATVGNKSLPQASRLWIYPNPSTGIFAISAKANIEVYNIVGELIISENNATSIDLTAAPEGMYFVRLNGDKIEKLIKN